MTDALFGTGLGLAAWLALIGAAVCIDVIVARIKRTRGGTS